MRLILRKKQGKLTLKVVGRIGKRQKDSKDYVYMEKVYMRIEKFMRKKTPFLDGDFSIQDLCDSLYMSRSLVSRSINRIGNTNFRSYVNNYRVTYALELMQKDPRVKLSQIASLSGFNSIPSFNSSFKDVMSMCPSEYVRSLQLKEDLQYYSKKKESEPRFVSAPSLRDV